MILLGIETATTVCAAALVRDGSVMEEALLDSQNVHDERLVGQVDEVLRRAGIGIGSVDAIAVSIGPGSFTGLRIGVSVAKGLAYAAALPVIGVPTLAALAHHAAAVDALPAGTSLLAALDARRDEVYCQLFTGERDHLAPAWDAAAMTVGELRQLIGGRKILVAGNGAHKVIGGEGAPIPEARAASPEASQCSAAAVALLGGAMMQAGARDDAATLEPRYIKEFFLKTR